MVVKNKKNKKTNSPSGVDDFGAYLPDKKTIEMETNSIKGRLYTEKEFREYNLKKQREEDNTEDKYDLLSYAPKV